MQGPGQVGDTPAGRKLREYGPRGEAGECRSDVL